MSKEPREDVLLMSLCMERRKRGCILSGSARSAVSPVAAVNFLVSWSTSLCVYGGRLLQRVLPFYDSARRPVVGQRLLSGYRLMMMISRSSVDRSVGTSSSNLFCARVSCCCTTHARRSRRRLVSAEVEQSWCRKLPILSIEVECRGVCVCMLYHACCHNC